MSPLALSLLLIAAQPAPKPVAQHIVTATVQIVAAEEIRFEDVRNADRRLLGKTMARQTRRRDGMPMVEFY